MKGRPVGRPPEQPLRRSLLRTRYTPLRPGFPRRVFNTRNAIGQIIQPLCYPVGRPVEALRKCSHDNVVALLGR